MQISPGLLSVKRSHEVLPQLNTPSLFLRIMKDLINVPTLFANSTNGSCLPFPTSQPTQLAVGLPYHGGKFDRGLQTGCLNRLVVVTKYRNIAATLTPALPRPGVAYCRYLPFDSGSGFRCFWTLIAHLLHELPHGSSMTGQAAFDPRFIALRGFFQICEQLLVRESLATLRHDALDEFPRTKKLAVSFKKQVFV
jgi:hypothetical protein